MDPDALNLVMLGARLALGGMLIFHGVGKLKSIDGTAGWFESIGMKPGRLNGWLAASTEVGAGVLMGIGLFTTFAAAGFVALMVVAAVTTHVKNGFFILEEGWEYVFIIGVFAVVVATIGPGEWSIDDASDIADDLDSWTGLVISAAGGVVAAVGQLAVFYRPPVSAD